MNWLDKIGYVCWIILQWLIILLAGAVTWAGVVWIALMVYKAVVACVCSCH